MLKNSDLLLSTAKQLTTVSCLSCPQKTVHTIETTTSNEQLCEQRSPFWPEIECSTKANSCEVNKAQITDVVCLKAKRIC